MVFYKEFLGGTVSELTTTAPSDDKYLGRYERSGSCESTRNKAVVRAGCGFESQCIA